MTISPSRPLRLLVPDLPAPEALLPWLRRMAATGTYTNFGPLCCELEARLAEQWSGEHPVAVTTTSNGTSALTLALAALDLPKGSAVLVPALTFPATAAAVVAAGLEPVLGAVDTSTWLMPPSLAERATAAGVAAAVPVAVFGRPVPLAPWDELSGRTGLKVVIDAAGAIGDQRVGSRVGMMVSLHATKPLSAGEGGIFATADADWVNRVRQRSNFGFSDGVCLHPDGNAKLSEYHAAAALAGLETWPQRAWRLRRLVGVYAAALARLGERVELPAGHRPWVRTTMVVRLQGGVSDSVMDDLAESGVPSRRWYHPPLTRHPAYTRCATLGDIASTERLANSLLGLPFHRHLSESDIQRVVTALDSALP